MAKMLRKQRICWDYAEMLAQAVKTQEEKEAQT